MAASREGLFGHFPPWDNQGATGKGSLRLSRTFTLIKKPGTTVTEASRVLRPGGRLAFQASLAGPVPGVYYPTLWADDAQLSFLVSPEECRRLLVATGFQECTWHDVTAQAVAQAQTRSTAGSEGASVRAIIAPTNMEGRVANRFRNYAEGRVVQVMAVFERPA